MVCIRPVELSSCWTSYGERAGGVQVYEKRVRLLTNLNVSEPRGGAWQIAASGHAPIARQTGRRLPCCQYVHVALYLCERLAVAADGDELQSLDV